MPFDRTTGTRRPGVTKSQVPSMRIDNIEALILKNRKKLQKHSDKRHTSVRVLDSPGSTAGVEGELATNGTAMWIYLNGAWQETGCYGTAPVIENGEILTTGRVVGGISFSTVNMVGISSTEIIAEPDSGMAYFVALWNADKTKILIEQTMAGGGRQVEKINPDGSDKEIVFSYVPFSNGPFWSPETNKVSVADRNDPWYIREWNFVTGAGPTTIWTPADGIIAATSYQRCDYFWYSPDGTKLSAEYSRTSPSGSKYVIRDLVAGTNHDLGITHFQTNDPPRWNPLGNGQLAYVDDGGFRHKIALITEDTVDAEYEEIWPGFTGNDIGVAVWSPDGTMLAFWEWDFNVDPETLTLYVIDLTGEIVNTWAMSAFEIEESYESIAWAEDNNLLVSGFGSDSPSTPGTMEMFNVETGEVTIIEGAPNTYSTVSWAAGFQGY